MAVSYEKLWELLDEHCFSLRLFGKVCGISPSTLSRMKQGEFVELGIIDKICTYFNCDYSDVITHISKWEKKEKEYTEKMLTVREALKAYMQRKNISIADVYSITGLSINTIKGFLSGNNISAMSFLKMSKLGVEFDKELERQKRALNKPKTEERKKMERIYYPAKKIVNVSDVVRINLLLSIPRGRLTRNEDMEAYVAKQLGVELIHFESNCLIDMWKFENKLSEIIPHWRTVSVQGWLTESTECSRDRQETKLREEDFYPKKCGPNNRSLRIENYKDYLFDFEKELSIEYSALEDKATTERLVKAMRNS